MDTDTEAAESEADEAAELGDDNEDTSSATEAPNDDASPELSEDFIKRRACTLAHKNEKFRSSVLLEEACKTAKENHSYDSAATQKKMLEECKERSGGKIIPHDWQLDIAKCLLLSVDCELIAPMGAGKTIPFVLPLFYNKEKVMIIISPLNALEEDQAWQFWELGITAVPVNGKTYMDKLHKEVTNEKHWIIVTSPDMCLEHDHFHSLLNAPAFARKVCSFIIDEAHCITQWGNKFREVYLRLGTLRAFMSARVPFLVTLVTLTPADLAVICKSVHLERNDTYHLNLGNDRPNLTWHVRNMKAGKSDLESLTFLLLTKDKPKLKRAIIFFDDISVSMDACCWFREQLPANLRDHVACYNSQHGESSKHDSYQRFCDGELDIWFASEAARIGCDIPKIEVVAQFMVPASL
ncbi:hypothetical protein EWM64_g5807 [Hericium alpestre]|uniref:Helicase ATP-binding domain-containing protein n=1 Tax=Hericium alpestre TaxID=135208 RepID=A0A4Y9ZTS3_9AGAM|nr:hypothetical protein EWM64_g5807 [Hericium alpestre]